jgi:ATP-dependent Clp protease ATP-binding subunit ClpA
MTSNLGGEHLAHATHGALGFELGGGEKEREVEEERAGRADVLSDVHKFFRPEFLNRLDEIVIFHSLGMEHLLAIVDLQLAILAKTVAGRGLVLEVSQAAKERLTKDGFDRAFGARPLRRKIQEVIINPLALRVLQGEFKDGDRVLVDFLDDKYVISKG